MRRTATPRFKMGSAEPLPNRPIVLRTERLILRPYTAADAEDIMAYAVDREWSRYLPGVPFPYTPADAGEFLANVTSLKWDEEVALGIEYEGHVVGGVRMAVDAAHQTAEIGYSIGRAHWGKGLVPEAAAAVLDLAFEKYQMETVHAHAHSRNTQSHRVMEKIGMKHEGILRSRYKNEDGRIDVTHYSILRTEWEARTTHT